MALFELTNEERMRLQRLNLDTSAVFALKKLFLNVCTNDPASNEAIKKITQVFHDLSVIRPQAQSKDETINII